MRDQTTPQIANHGRLWIALLLSGFLLSPWIINTLAAVSLAQRALDAKSLTPLQLEIEKQRQRLVSPEVEERRDAVMRLGQLRHPEASRAAVIALKDTFSIVRATASGAVLWLSAEESAAALIPLLSDKAEFVRQETAYALGRTRSKNAVEPLIQRLRMDKNDGVRGAAAVALGEIANEAAAVPLAHLLSPSVALPGGKKTKSKSEQNVFVLRAAAHSLGQIASRAAVPALIAIVEDEKAADDVRREAAGALGLIGDPSAVPALRKVLTAADPYLALAAYKALGTISKQQIVRP